MARPRRLGRAERLDPIRWRRPGRSPLLRLGAIAALLLTAALITWSGPQSCAPPAAQTGAGSATSRPAAAASATPPATDKTPGLGAKMPTGTVGVPVRLAEPTALTLVHSGDHVDLLRVNATGHDTTPVAVAALVLGVTGADDPTMGGLLLALTPAEAAKAVADPNEAFAVLIRP